MDQTKTLSLPSPLNSYHLPPKRKRAMENQGNNRPVVFAQLELDGQRMECPVCHVTLDAHFGKLIVPEFYCHGCGSSMTLMDTSSLVICPCCHFSRPRPTDIIGTECRGCEATVIHPKEARSVTCSLCRSITAACPINRMVAPQPDPRQSFPPHFNWSVSPQVNLANPREQAILVAQVNQSLNPRVNQPRIIHPKVIHVSPRGRGLYPRANQAAPRTQVNHVAQVNQNVQHPQVINQVATRNQFNVAQVNRNVHHSQVNQAAPRNHVAQVNQTVHRPQVYQARNQVNHVTHVNQTVHHHSQVNQVATRNQFNVSQMNPTFHSQVGPRNRGNMVGPRNRGNMVAQVNQTVHHQVVQVNQDVPHVVTPPQVNWNAPHAVNHVAPFQVNWNAPHAVNHVAPPQVHWSAPYVNLLSPRDGNHVVPPAVNEVATPRAHQVAPLNVDLIATLGANQVATPGANHVAPPDVNVVANQVATPRANQVAPLALNVVATPGANQVAPLVVNGVATPGSSQVAPIHVESDSTASSSSHPRPNGVRKSIPDDTVMKRIADQIRETAYKNRRDNAAAEEEEKPEGSKSKKSRQ